MPKLLIPPKVIKRLPGRARLGRRVRVHLAHRCDAAASERLIDVLEALAVTGVDTNDGGQGPRTESGTVGDVRFRRSRRGGDHPCGHPEGYELRIDRGGIEIVSSTAAGAYYAVQTLCEWLNLHGRTLPCCEIGDWPTFARRAIYLDCSRGKVPTTKTLTDLIERLSRWKLNELQLYIENVFQFKGHPAIGKGFSPFSAEDIRIVQAHAKRHHMRLVPSIASFGHMEKILMLPEYQHLGEMPGFRDLPGGTTLYPGDPRSIQLLESLYDAFLPLFEAEDVNICGDEPWELGKGRSKRRASRIGVGRVYLDFILKIHRLCRRHDKRMNMWGDIVLSHPEIIPDIPKDIVMLNWDYSVDGSRVPRSGEFTAAGLDLVCCPGAGDWQSHGSRLPVALRNVSQFAKVALACQAEGMLHTSWGDGGHRNTLAAGLCSFSHAAAHAWHTEGVEDAAHVRNYTFHTHGDRDGALARSLELLGTRTSGYWAYHALVERLTATSTWHSGHGMGRTLIDRVYRSAGDFKKRANPSEGSVVNGHDVMLSDQAAKRHDERLARLVWPAPDRADSAFDAISLREYALAASMERLAYQRLPLARALREGRPVDRKALNAHLHAYRAMVDDFNIVWRLRNRPSRLRDNLAAFRKAILELEDLVAR